MKKLQLSITLGFAAVAALVLAFSMSKSVTAAGTFTVSNTMDSGSGSLRQAINDAGAGGGTIDATGVSGVIDLLTTLPQLNSNLIINGPGAAHLTVERTFAGGTPDFNIFIIRAGRVVVISGLTIKNGKDFGGGGLENFGTLTLSNCTLANNSATNFGGAIYNSGTLTINNSTLANNDSAIFGGGIFNSGNGPVTISNSTLANNSAQNGGGIYNGSGTLTISNATLANNSALECGGILNGGTVILQSTIVARNSASIEPDVLGDFTSSGHNLIGNTSGGNGWVASDQLNTDPLFELDLSNKPLLKNNGGATQTIALLCGSPAIDRGKNLLALTTDQRGVGFARTFDDAAVANSTGGDSTDIGSFEAQQPSCFDICLQDDGGNACLQINSQTGDYQFCYQFFGGGRSYTGKGKVTLKGSLVTFQDYGSTRRVIAKVDRSTNRATASLQSPPGSTLSTIIDRDTRNNTCSCTN